MGAEDSQPEENSAPAPGPYGTPFQRPFYDLKSDALARLLKELATYSSKLAEPLSEPPVGDVEAIKFYSQRLVEHWRSRERTSEIAYQGLLLILEFCLNYSTQHYELFDTFLSELGYHSVAFWKLAVPRIYDSDLSSKTRYRDSLLFSLALYDVNNSKHRLRELYAAVPGVRQSMLGVHAKRFGERYRHIQVCSLVEELNLQMVRSRANSRMSSVQGSVEDLACGDNDVIDDGTSEGNSDGVSSASTSFLDHSHHKQRVINVSNAPPVSLNRKNSGSWEIKQGSGGLVACVDPVMSVDHDNIWLANLGINIKQTHCDSLSDHGDKDMVPPSTNSLGLPLIRQARAGEIFHVLEESEKKTGASPVDEDVERDMSLLSVLHDYNKTNYQLNPVFVNQEDYNAYYGGISNGLLWPALHNLGEYIVKDYDDIAVREKRTFSRF